MPKSAVKPLVASPAPKKERALRVFYDCSKCPAYCCSYDRIIVTRRDIQRLARYFHITPEAAEKRFTRIGWGERILRHQKDTIYGSICKFLDLETRRCTIYEARPNVCRGYPETPRCGYFTFLSWERMHQDDPEFIPLQLG